MKKFNKVMALVLSVAVVLAMSVVPAFAASITLNENDTHEYKVFQVLTGTLAKEGDKQLGNPAWGADAIADPGDVNAFITEITATGLSEADIAAKVAAKVDTTGNGRGTVKGGTPLTGLATGYYVLVDQTQLTGDHKLDTKSLHVVQVLNDNTLVNIKYGTTEDKKTIESDTLGKDEGTNDINGAKDNVSVGDTVNYKITAKVPANADKYNYFYFVINDSLDPGLTLDANSIKVYKTDTTEANKLDLTKDYLVKTGSDAAPKTFQVGLVDAKSHAGEDIIVTYSAVLNENATIGEVPNKNTSTVTYSNDPNHDYAGENNPGFPASVDESAMGETPVTETKTYTTGIEIQKVDQDGKVLTGATFKLSGTSTKKVLTVAETFTAADDGNYYKLKDGTYTKTEPTNEGEYMVKTAGATAGYVIDASYNGDDKKVVDGVTYRPYVPTTDKDMDVYVLHNGNGHLYESTTTKYKKSTEKTVVDATTSHEVEKAVDANGLVRFDGLGAGTYTIAETGTPSGYNTLPDLTVTVSFNAAGEKVWSFSGGKGSYDSEEGIYKITIENKQGSTLPETGGIGTTIFYVLGAILVIGAGVLLVTRRRMNAN